MRKADFFEFSFFVCDSVFQPRPETEILVETCLKFARYMAEKKDRLTVVDVGTGTGCIIISVARKLKELLPKGGLDKHFIFIGTDIDEKALKIAEANAKDNGVKIILLKTNLLCGIEKLLEELGTKHADIVVSNPPYIPSEIKDEIRVPDPPHTLFGGKKGYELTLELISQTSKIISEDGILILETGYDDLKFYDSTKSLVQEYKNSILKAAEEHGFKLLKIVKDYSRLERILVFQRV